MRHLRKHRNVILRILDILVIIFSYFISESIIDNNFDIASKLNPTFFYTIILALIVYIGLFHIFKTYKNITRYENGNDYLVYVLACLIGYIIIALLRLVFNINIANPRVNMVAALIIVTAVIGYRVTLRLILTEWPYKNTGKENNDNRKNVLIIGAGEAARIVIRTLKTTMRDTYHIVGLIDDNVNKINYFISGNKIIGTRKDIPKICKEKNVELILFTISNISNKDRKDILSICQETNCKVRILPGTKDIIKNKNLMDSFRDVEIEDLLGRDTVKLDNRNIKGLIENNAILVTGGGGSIGSELCRQIINYNPKKLIIVDIYENNLYDIEQELKAKYPNIEICAIVASVRDKKRLEEIFAVYKPYLVFHAAAHKHVPLMETSPLEAIKNNVFGTLNTVIVQTNIM